MLLEIDNCILHYIQRCQRHLIQSYSCLLDVENPGPIDGIFSDLVMMMCFHIFFECPDMYLRVCQFLLYLWLQSNKMFAANILVILLMIIWWHQFGKSKQVKHHILALHSFQSLNYMILHCMEFITTKRKIKRKNANRWRCYL